MAARSLKSAPLPRAAATDEIIEVGLANAPSGTALPESDTLQASISKPAPNRFGVQGQLPSDDIDGQELAGLGVGVVHSLPFPHTAIIV
jgi:hypothetical protein